MLEADIFSFCIFPLGWKAIQVAHSAGRLFACYDHQRMLQILWTHFSIKSILCVTPFVHFSWSEGQGTKNIPSISIIFNFPSFFLFIVFQLFQIGCSVVRIWEAFAITSFQWVHFNTLYRRERLVKAGGVITLTLPQSIKICFPIYFHFISYTLIFYDLMMIMYGFHFSFCFWLIWVLFLSFIKIERFMRNFFPPKYM